MFNSDVLDDPIISDEQAGFGGGQVSFQAARKLKANECAELINCDITLLGDIVTRRGSVRLGTGAVLPASPTVLGLTYYDTPTQSRLVAATTNGLYYFNGTTWVLMVATALGSGAPFRVRFAQGINKLYLADGALDIAVWDGAAITSLGHALASQPPAAPRWITWHTNRLCATGIDAEPDAIYFSQFLDGATWDKANWQIRVGAGEDDAIMGLVSWTNSYLVVLKRRSIWIVDCDPSNTVATFPIKCVHRRIGCTRPDTAVQVGSDVFFLSDSGVRSLHNVIATESQSEVGEAMSSPVQDVILRLTADPASAVYWNNRYILSAIDAVTSQRRCLVYNTLTHTWSGIWTGLNATYFSYRQPSSVLSRLCFAKTNGEVHEWLDYQRRDEEVLASFQDQGVDIPTTVRTRALDFGERQSKKTGLNVEVELFDSSATTVTLNRRLNGATVDTSMQSFAANSNAYGAAAVDLRKSVDLQSLGPFRELQLSLTTTAGKLGVRSLNANAFAETLELQT